MNIDQEVELLSLMPISEEEASEKYKEDFDNQAQFLGNGVYCWHDISSSDTRELWLLGVLAREGVPVPFDDDDDFDDDDTMY